MKAIPAGPRVESNIGQHDTKRRSERRFQGGFEANSAHSDVYSFGGWENANVPNEIGVVKNIKLKKDTAKLLKVAFRVSGSTFFLE